MLKSCRLHEEIDDYLKYVTPTEAEHALRKLTVDRIRQVAIDLWPNATVHVFGSFDTKLYLPSRF